MQYIFELFFVVYKIHMVFIYDASDFSHFHEDDTDIVMRISSDMVSVEDIPEHILPKIQSLAMSSLNCAHTKSFPHFANLQKLIIPTKTILQAHLDKLPKINHLDCEKLFFDKLPETLKTLVINRQAHPLVFRDYAFAEIQIRRSVDITFENCIIDHLCLINVYCKIQKCTINTCTIYDSNDLILQDNYCDSLKFCGQSKIIVYKNMTVKWLQLKRDQAIHDDEFYFTEYDTVVANFDTLYTYCAKTLSIKELPNSPSMLLRLKAFFNLEQLHIYYPTAREMSYLSNIAAYNKSLHTIYVYSQNDQVLKYLVENEEMYKLYGVKLCKK